MAKEKDITEKLLFEKEDVFADILNVLLFEGEELILPETLVPTGQKSQIKIAKTIHEQERDVAKLWMNGKIIFAFLGVENQTDVERDMILRVISYDGSSYKEQVIHNRRADVEKWAPYPVITIVLYFGMTHWSGPKTLIELLGDRVPEKMKPYVNDYKLNVFEIAFLSPEKVAKFKSDFRIVADYFVQMRTNKEYKPSQETIIHVEEILKLMSVLTSDTRFEESANGVKKGGHVNMCEVLNVIEARGKAEGRAEGRAEGLAEGRAEGLAKGRAEGRAEGLAKGRAEGRLKTFFELVIDGVLTATDAAKRVNLTESEFVQRLKSYQANA